MAAPPLPDFDHTLRLGSGNLDAAGLSESHGLLCGLVCRQSSGSAAEFLRELAAMRLVVEPGQGLLAALTEAWQSTVAQFEDSDLGFALWLPDDDEPLDERTVALARWCAGFLAGLGSGGQLDALSDESREAITDLQEISRAELAVSDLDYPPTEDDESAYAEVVEYVRVVALLLREDFRGPQAHEAIH